MWRGPLRCLCPRTCGYGSVSQRRCRNRTRGGLSLALMSPTAKHWLMGGWMHSDSAGWGVGGGDEGGVEVVMVVMCVVVVVCVCVFNLPINQLIK